LFADTPSEIEEGGGAAKLKDKEAKYKPQKLNS
jgi:hypothetical protein